MGLRSPVCLALTILVFAACAGDPFGPRVLDGPLSGLEARLRVEPGEVSRREAFTVRLELTNITADTIVVVTPNSCLYSLRLTRNDQPVHFDGSSWGCFEAVSRHVFPPGETRPFSHGLAARMYSHPEDGRMIAAPTGAYLMEVIFELFPEEGRGPGARAFVAVR